MLSSSANTLIQVAMMCLTIILAIHLILSPKEASGRRKPRIELAGTTSLEARFFSDLRDRKVQDWSLADAFFIASGIRDESNLKRARDWLDQLVEEARVALKPHQTTSNRADHLLRWLHKRALSKYHAQSTSALELIRTGHFNCLSSCLLYGMIGERLGLHIRGIIVDQHAFCRVYQKSQPRYRRSMTSREGGWDVETTTPLGFNPGRSVQLDQAIVSVPRHRYRNRREISLFEMIGLIYTNHVGLTRAYPTLEDQLLAYQKASLFFSRDPVIQHNVVAAHTQIISRAIDQNRWKQAKEYLKNLSEIDPKSSESTLLWLTLIDRHLSSVASQNLEAVLSLIQQYSKDNPPVNPAVWPLQEAKYYANTATQLLIRGDQTAGINQFNQALERAKRGHQLYQRASRTTRQQLQTFHHNSLVPIKNLVISTINAQQVELASQLTQIALRYLPHDQDLHNLSTTLRKAQQGSRNNSRNSKISRPRGNSRSTQQKYRVRRHR